MTVRFDLMQMHHQAERWMEMYQIEGVYGVTGRIHEDDA